MAGLFGSSLWIVYALITAICWSVFYVASDVLMKDHSVPPTLLLILQGISTLIAYIVIAIITQSINISEAKDILSKPSLIGIMFITSTFLAIGGYTILLSMQLKNAAMANFIEISYPFFTILLSLIFIKDFQISLWTVCGGVLIIGGIAMIYLKG